MLHRNIRVRRGGRGKRREGLGYVGGVMPMGQSGGGVAGGKNLEEKKWRNLGIKNGGWVRV